MLDGLAVIFHLTLPKDNPLHQREGPAVFPASVQGSTADFAQLSYYSVVSPPTSFLSAGDRMLPDSCGTTNSVFLLTAAAWFYFGQRIQETLYIFVLLGRHFYPVDN